ncbi:ABC transporter substrate-binding protein [Lentzea cavernae]|uniref:Sulfonate ABC transporter substrate-binding protein n=1 Tax=Lentzea cavernae TaxID=2020703 RepID=A0ABQ3MA43_9PSEU|nr:ABC transporter substrate-binding protein [Lentzea cavernae]GHH35032.1 sulfonate ABC transporter substrate-binding protein [Lentzea cavernae]
MAARRRIAGLLSAAAVLAAVSGCGFMEGEQPLATSSPPEVEKIRIKVGVLPVVDVAPLHIATKNGYFEKEGLEVETVVVQGGAAAIPGLIKGSLDITFGNWVSFIAAQSDETAKDVGGIKLISDAYQAKPGMFLILVKGNGSIRSLTDLVGKTIAINTLNNISELTTKAVLEANNIDPKKVTLKAMPMPDMEAAIERNVVDAGFMSEPFITRAQRNSGQIAILDAASGPTSGIPIAGYGTTGKFVEQNPRTVAAFQRAMAKGQRDASDRATVQALLPEYAGVDRDTSKLVNLGQFPTSLDATRLQRVATLMKTYGLLQTDLDIEPMLVRSGDR